MFVGNILNDILTNCVLHVVFEALVSVLQSKFQVLCHHSFGGACSCFQVISSFDLCLTLPFLVNTTVNQISAIQVVNVHYSFRNCKERSTGVLIRSTHRRESCALLYRADAVSYDQPRFFKTISTKETFNFTCSSASCKQRQFDFLILIKPQQSERNCIY